MGVSYLDGLVLFEKESGAAAGGEGLWGRHGLRIKEGRMERKGKESILCTKLLG